MREEELSVDVGGRVFASGSVVEEGAKPVGRGTKPKDAGAEPKGGKTTTECRRAEVGDKRIEPEDRASTSTVVCDGSKLGVFAGGSVVEESWVVEVREQMEMDGLGILAPVSSKFDSFSDAGKSLMFTIGRGGQEESVSTIDSSVGGD